jgi:hypothetical protein
MQPWIADELCTADLGDDRLNQRYRLLLDRLSLKPSLKFTAACRGWAEVQAAYRFVNNPRVDAATLLTPHRDATLQRIRCYAVVVLVQDSTETDLTRPHEQVHGAGPLNDADRLGLYMHNVLALTPQRLPLGTVATSVWARDAQQFDQTPRAKRAQRKAKPIQDKESFRWLQGYQQACAVATACPQTQIICVSDSEGDIYECLAADKQLAAEQRPAQWIVRACQDRAVVPDSAAAVGPLFSAAAAGPVLQTRTIEVSKRQPKSKDGRKRKQARAARQARVTVQAARLTLRGPQRPGGKLADVAVNVVLVREPAPPAGQERIEWLLLTSLPMDTVEQVLAVVEYYCCRWQIEIYYRVLKSGCQVERSQLHSAEAFEAYLALCLIVAWRVLYVLMLGRECPELACAAVLEPEEWQAVYTVVHGAEPPVAAPPLGDMVRMIARLGGYLGRKGDGPPGPKAMWQGMQRMTDLALGWQAFNTIVHRSTG